MIIPNVLNEVRRMTYSNDESFGYYFFSTLVTDLYASDNCWYGSALTGETDHFKFRCRRLQISWYEAVDLGVLKRWEPCLILRSLWSDASYRWVRDESLYDDSIACATSILCTYVVVNILNLTSFICNAIAIFLSACRNNAVGRVIWLTLWTLRSHRSLTIWLVLTMHKRASNCHWSTSKDEWCVEEFTPNSQRSQTWTPMSIMYTTFQKSRIFSGNVGTYRNSIRVGYVPLWLGW